MNDPNQTIAARFRKYDTKRSTNLTRSREYAALVMPSLLPEEGTSNEDDLPVPYNSLPAEGVMGLSARLSNVLVPLNQIPFQQSNLNEALVPEGEDSTQSDEVLARLDRRVMKQLSGTNLRSMLFICMQHIQVVGDVLLIQKSDYNFQIVRKDAYIVRRAPDGEWRELIIQEWVNPEFLPEGLKNLPHSGSPAQGVGPNDSLEALYTQIKYNPDTLLYDAVREFRGNVIETDVAYEVPPFYPLRWSAVVGEDWGRSLVEEAYGDLQSLDLLTKALLDACSLNAEYRWGLDPAGQGQARDWNEGENGSLLTARPGDFFVIQAANQAQVELTMRAVAEYEARIGKRFLLNSAVQPTGERVTARQVTILANELEQALGGVLPMLARDIQIPIARRTMYQMAQDKLIPSELSKYLADTSGKSILTLTVKSGIESLNREVENDKLTTLAQMIGQMPPDAVGMVNWDKFLVKWMSTFGIETVGLVKTEEQQAAEQEAAMQQQQAMSAQETASQAALIAAQQGEQGTEQQL